MRIAVSVTASSPIIKLLHLGIASLIISVPEQVASVASNCQGQLLRTCTPPAMSELCLWMRTSLRKRRPTLEHQGASNKLVLLTVPVALTLGQLEIFDTGVANCLLQEPRALRENTSRARTSRVCTEDHLLVCSQRNANLWSVTQTMYTHVLQEDKMLGDRKCPCKHVIDRLVRGPWTAITPSETRADEGVDCDHISEKRLTLELRFGNRVICR